MNYIFESRKIEKPLLSSLFRHFSRTTETFFVPSRKYQNPSFSRDRSTKKNNENNFHNKKLEILKRTNEIS